MSKRLCPICQKEYKNILAHFSIKHGFDSMEKVEQEIQKAEKNAVKQKAYMDFITELDNKLKANEITIEEWRTKRDNWKFE